MTASGERVGSYEIIEEVGHGALATVFLARQLRSHRDVALKRLRLDPPDTPLARRLVDEVDAVMALTHPNISSVIDCFEYDGMPYVVMEHIPGGSLRHVHRSLAPAQVVGVLEQILAALAHAEIEHVVHGDLKPENVLVARDGVVKVADFAIARACRTALHRGAGHAPVGTPAYMAPEQALGRPEGPPTDLYAVGVMAYEMLAGRLPFGAAASSPAVLARHVHDPVPSLGPRADPALDEWVGHMLAKDPASRPQRASAAWRELEEVAVRAAGPHWRFSAALPERPIAAPARFRSSTTRRRRLASTALAVAALAGVGTLVAFGRDSAPPQTPRTEIVRRAPTHGIARALRPVIAANRHLTRQLNALAGPPPATAALAAVGKGRAATRWTVAHQRRPGVRVASASGGALPGATARRPARSASRAPRRREPRGGAPPHRVPPARRRARTGRCHQRCRPHSAQTLGARATAAAGDDHRASTDRCRGGHDGDAGSLGPRDRDADLDPRTPADADIPAERTGADHRAPGAADPRSRRHTVTRSRKPPAMEACLSYQVCRHAGLTYVTRRPESVVEPQRVSSQARYGYQLAGLPSW